MSRVVKKIGWKVSGLSPDLASVRYRAILPFVSLEKVGIQSSIISSVIDVDVDSFDAVIIVKSFTPEDLYLAQQASAKNVPVFFDLCDNIFIGDYRGKQAVTPAEMFFAMSVYFSGVLVTTQPLKKVVETVLEGNMPVFVVPDGVETKRDVDRAKKILGDVVKSEIKKSIKSALSGLTANSAAKMFLGGQKIRLARHHIKTNLKNYLRPLTWVKKAYAIYDHARSGLTGRPRKTGKSFDFFSKDTFLAGQPVKRVAANKDIKRILWFGNHGAKYAQFGMLDLLSIRTSLERLNKEIPFELIVVSNNKEKFLKYISRFDCITRYVEWSSDVVDAMLDIVDVVVVPNSKDEFSICKSSNRTVMALNANVPVVADLTPALEDLQQAIYVDDFYHGLKQCFNDAKEVKNKIALGKQKIKENYGKNTIANAFLHAFSAVDPVATASMPNNAVVVVLHLLQDFELAKPLIERLKSLSAPYFVWISYSLARKSSKVLSYLKDEQIAYYCLPEDLDFINSHLFSRVVVSSIITMAETNLGPHKFTHTLTEKANALGIKTFTLQHGFENVGLTYTDSVHDINKILIAAKTIFIWGDASTLHSQVPAETRARVLSVGCPKEAGQPVEKIPQLEALDRKIIGVFENLHWHRYSQAYQEDFLKTLSLCAAKYPQIIFFIKPHPAGMWLTSRFKGQIPTADNIIVADPLSSEWEKYSINAVLGKTNAVISTPSTVVLDAVREGLPTLVCGFDLELDNYLPLPIAVSSDDWFNFIDNIVHRTTGDYADKNASFIQRTLIAGDATNKIINSLLAN